MSALAEAQRMLDGLCHIARGAGLPVPPVIRVAVSRDVPRYAGAMAHVVDGVPTVTLRGLPERLESSDRIDLRGILAHELGHHCAGLGHNHRKSFRLVLAKLAAACCLPPPCACDENPTRRDHPKRWIGASSMPAWLRSEQPRRIRQIRAAWGMAPERSQSAPAAAPIPRVPCTVPQAVALASVVALCAAVLA